MFPSETENFPICFLEAMVAGLAIITTKNTGCAEVVGDAALIVEAKNVADIKPVYKRLVEDKELRKELGQKRESASKSFLVGGEFETIRVVCMKQ